MLAYPIFSVSPASVHAMAAAAAVHAMAAAAASPAEWKSSLTEVVGSAPFFQATLIISALLAVAVLSWLFLTRHRHHKLKEDALPLPPGRMGLPLLGETLQLLRTQRQNRAWAFVEDRVKEFGSETFKTSLFGDPTVVVANPAGNKMAFASSNVSWPKSILDVVGPQSLIAHNGSYAHRLRQALHSFLNPDALRRYTRPVSRIAIASIANIHHEPIQILTLPFMRNLTFTIISSIVVGIRNPADQASLFDHFTDLAKGVFQIPIKLPGTRFSNAIKGARAIKAKLQSVIDESRASASAAGDVTVAAVEEQKVVDVMSGLLNFKDEEGKGLSDEEIKDNIVLMLYAGNDTSTVVITLVFRYLALNPSIMDQVYKENKEIAEGKKVDMDGYVLEWEDVQKMKLTWRVVQETMRMQPPVQGDFRIAKQDMNFDGYTIPKSWKIYWTVNSTHRNPKYFPDPDKFDPSRFQGTGPAPFTFVPFGGGPRMCPGNELARMEILIILHYFITHFSWSLKHPNETITVDPMPTPVKGLPILLHPRACSSATTLPSAA